MTLNSSMHIAASGLSAQSARLKIHANNIANTGTPNYVRKIPLLYENDQMAFEDILGGLRSGTLTAGLSVSTGGVNLSGVLEDPTPGRRVYQPGHPEADEDGYVTYSNVNVLADMSDAMATQRLYEANLAVLGIVKQMANRAMEIGRGG